MSTPRCIDASAHQRVDASTRRRADASTRGRVDESTRRRVDTLTPRVTIIGELLFLAKFHYLNYTRHLEIIFCRPHRFVSSTRVFFVHTKKSKMIVRGGAIDFVQKSLKSDLSSQFFGRLEIGIKNLEFLRKSRIVQISWLSTKIISAHFTFFN